MLGEHSAPSGTIARVLLAADLPAPVSWRSCTDRPSTRRSGADPGEQRQDCPIHRNTLSCHGCHNDRHRCGSPCGSHVQGCADHLVPPGCCVEWANLIRAGAPPSGWIISAACSSRTVSLSAATSIVGAVIAASCADGQFCGGAARSRTFATIAGQRSGSGATSRQARCYGLSQSWPASPPPPGIQAARRTSASLDPAAGDHRPPLLSSTLSPPSWTSKMKCGAGSPLQ